MSESTGRQPLTRRDEYAEITRLAVIGAARELFGRYGHAKTKVDDIACRARVSPSTVYATCGGKQGLLETLMDTWTEGPVIQEIVDDCRNASTGRGMLAILADGYLTVYGQSGDIMRIVTEAASSTVSAQECLRTANARHRQALAEIVAGIRVTGELLSGLSDDDVVKAIFYHFRYEQFALATEEFGWSRVRSRDTIRTWLERAVLTQC